MLKNTKINEKFIKVNLGDRSYPIFIGAGNLISLAEKLNNFKLTERPVVISNPEVLALYKSKIDQAFEKVGLGVDYFEVPSGEESKTVEKALALIDKFFDIKADRQTPVIAVGGGVIGDLAGYVSATFMRGMPYIQVPTTLLAQLDSSVGGKVAVNYREAKNIIGFFYQPKFVLADVGTLSTLTKRDYACGLAETIKYSLIADNDFLKYMEENIHKLNDRDEEVLTEVVTRCCRIKAKIVEEDERDLNIRGVLNLGHTIGHAIEGRSHFVEYRHGEAVSIGIIASAYMSLQLGYIDQELVRRIKALIEKAGLPTKVKHVNKEEIINAIKMDKKVLAGQARFVLLKRPGETVIEPVDSKIVKNALEKVIDG